MTTTATAPTPAAIASLMRAQSSDARVHVEETADLSHDEIRNVLYAAVRELLLEDPESPSAMGPWIRDIWDDRIVFEYEGRNWQATYTMTDDGATLGQPVEVEQIWQAVGDAAGGAGANPPNGEEGSEGSAAGESKPTRTEAAIASHKTPTDDEATWNGPAAVRDAPESAAILRYMHAWQETAGDADVKASYKFPHHLPKAGSAAILSGVNNALARLSTSKIPAADKSGVEAHLRKHRKDAGLDESMSGLEIFNACKTIIRERGLDSEAADHLLGCAVRRELDRKAHRERVDILEESVALIEQAVRDDGTLRLKIIQPGWGSSGYYSPELLKRDGPAVFRNGLKMFWDHPTDREEEERPEGSLTNLASVLTSDAEWSEGPRGPGLYADAKVFDAYRPAVDELAPHIGVSIRAFGTAHPGEAEGRKGPILDELTAAMSVDYVTEPGAGGAILQAFEAKRSAAYNTDLDDEDPSKQGGVVTETKNEDAKLVKERDDAIAALAEARAQIVKDEALKLAEAKVADVEDLSEVTRKRIVAKVTTSPAPLTEDGKLDKAKFEEVIAAEVKGEIDYLQELTGAGKVREAGGTITKTDEKEAEELRQRQYEANRAMGMGENAAKHAAGIPVG
jgi:hypothetical protein